MAFFFKIQTISFKNLKIEFPRNARTQIIMEKVQNFFATVFWAVAYRTTEVRTTWPLSEGIVTQKTVRTERSDSRLRTNFHSEENILSHFDGDRERRVRESENPPGSLVKCRSQQYQNAMK